jgi:hypothetical protein
MCGLIPKEKQLYLPYSKRTVLMVYFDASSVLALLLSCPTLNQDEYFLLHDQKDPFAQPSKSADVGDINTGRCCRKTYDALMKKVGFDRVFPTILAMDKTHIDLGAHNSVARSIKARHALQTNCNVNPWLYQPLFPRTLSTTKYRQDHHQLQRVQLPASTCD